METYKLQQVSRNIEISPKNGREYEKLGLKINGEWYNGFGKKGTTDNWNADMEVVGIELYKKEYNGKEYNNWRFINIEQLVFDLEKRVSKLEGKGTELPWD